MNKCPTCDYENENLISLSVHFRKKHKSTSKALCIALFHNSVEPTCACGCSGAVKFCGIDAGFSKFILGHHARVHNNWGHNKEALAKSQDVRREQIATGEWKPWNRGLTEDSDVRVKENNEAISHSILSRPEERKKRADRMREDRLSGTIPSPVGSQHGQWKGGTSALQPIVRSHLHSRWTYPKLRASNFTCGKCGSKKDLEVHHNGERFAAILHAAILTLGEVIDDSFEQKSAIAEWVADYHVQNNVSGVVLCETCHNQEHAVA